VLELQPAPEQILMATLASKSRRGDLRRLVQATQNQLFACVQATLFADPWSFAGHLRSAKQSFNRSTAPSCGIYCQPRMSAVGDPIQSRSTRRSAAR
jgi:hypothetical protein